MWGNQTNGNRMNGRNDVNVNTRLKSFNSDVSSLALSLWNNNYSINISPAIGVDGNGITQYDQNRQGKTALTLEAAKSLIEKFNLIIKPVYDKVVSGDEDCPEIKSVTVKTGREPKINVIGIEMTPPSGDEKEPDFYFVFYGSVDTINNTANAAMTFKHKFAKRSVFEDYNPQTGAAKEIKVNADFATFMELIGAAKEMFPYAEHFKKYNSDRTKAYQNNNNNQTDYSGMSTSGNMNFASSPSDGGAGGFNNIGLFSGGLSGSDELPFS